MKYIFDSIFRLIVIAMLFVGIQFKIHDFQSKKNRNIQSSLGQGEFYFKEIKKANLATFTECIIAAIVVFVTVSWPAYQI